MRIIIYLFFFLSCFQGYSKKVNVDSLSTLLKSGKLGPKGQHKLYVRLFYDNFYKDPSKAIRYNNILYKVAKKYNLKSGMGDYFYNTAFIKFSKSDFKSAIAYSKMACKEFYEDKNIDYYLYGIARICNYLQADNRDIEAFQMAQNKIKLFKSFSNYSGLGDIYYFVAEYYFVNKKYKNVIINTKSSLQIFQNVKYYHGIITCNLIMAQVLFELENYSESIKYIEEVNELAKETNNNIVYQLIINDHMAKIYIKLKRYSESIQSSNRAIKIMQKSGFGLDVIEIMLYKSDAYQKLGNNVEALKIIKKIEQNINKYISEPNVVNSLKYMNKIKSNIFVDYKQYNLALEQLQKNLKFKDVDVSTYEDISNIQYKLHRYKEAFESQRLFQIKKITQLKSTQKNNIGELQVLYNVKENEFNIQNLKLKELNNNLEIKKQKEFLRNSIVVSVILVVVMIFGFYIYRIRIKVSQILKYKNEKLEISNELLNKSLREKELLLKEIHHRVKNNLQLVSSILDIQANESPNISVSEFLDKSQNRISSIALIHQNLYMSENLDKVDFQTYTDELVSCILDSFSEIGTIKYEIVANENCFNIQTSISLGLIISELSCNTIKHAFKDNKEGIIYIEIKQLENCKFELIFGDNGSGGIDTTDSSKSIGLELVGLLAMQLNGDIVKLDKKGTFYKVTFEEVSY